MSSASAGPQSPQMPQASQASQSFSGRPQVVPVRTDRSLLKYVLLSMVTLGIYGLWMMTETTNTVNLIASRYDARHSSHYLLMVFLLGWITGGIAWLVWFHHITSRVGDELQRRGYARLISASDFWLWDILGSMIIVGPFIFYYKFFKAVNALAWDYNERGM